MDGLCEPLSGRGYGVGHFCEPFADYPIREPIWTTRFSRSMDTKCSPATGRWPVSSVWRGNLSDDRTPELTDMSTRTRVIETIEGTER